MCVNCHNNDADQWRRLIGQSVRSTSILAPSWPKLPRESDGYCAGGQPDQPDGTLIGNRVAARMSGILSEPRTSLPAVDAGGGDTLAKGGVEPQAFWGRYLETG